MNKIRHEVEAVAAGAAVGGLEAAGTLQYGDGATTTLVTGIIAAVLVYVHRKFPSTN